MSNYNGRQPNNTSYIKNFIEQPQINLWKVASYQKMGGSVKSVITPSITRYDSLYIPGDLFVDGTIFNPSDINLKKNINLIEVNTSDKLMNLKPSSFILNFASPFLRFRQLTGIIEYFYFLEIIFKGSSKNILKFSEIIGFSSFRTLVL